MKSLVKVLVLASAFFSVSASALPWSEPSSSSGMDMGLLVGIRLNDGSSRVTGQSVDGSNSFQLGGLAFMPFNDKLSFRTGFIYAQRHFEVKTTAGTGDAEYAHFDIPLTVMYSLGDMGGIFLGPGIGLKVKDDCDGGDCPGSKSTIIPIQFGGHFKVAPQFSAEVYYETASGKLDDNIKDPSAVVVNAIITFE